MCMVPVGLRARSFSTIGDTSTSVSLGDTQTGQPKDAGPGSAGAGTEESGCSGLSDRHGRELAIVAPPPPVSGARRPRRGMRHAGWNSWSPKKLSGDYVATDNDVVRDGKTSEVGKMDSFADGLVVKKKLESCPYQVMKGCLTPRVCGKASYVDLRRPTGLSGSDAMRGSEVGGSQFDIVTVPELIEHPVVAGFADPPSASQPMQNTGEPRDLENDRLGRRDGMDIPPDIRTE